MLPRILCLLWCLAVILSAADARAERRVALVIGNAHYQHASALRNPLNDAKDFAAILKQLDFEVLLATDLDQQAFAEKIDQFGRTLEGADVALFFYAGHGMQVNNKNYLLSTQAKLENEFLIPAETVELDAIIRLMESRSRINLVFLDACRNNPLADRLRNNLIAANRSVSLGRGLARVEPTSRDMLIAFAAAPGQEAVDGRGRNSPFTGALLQNVPKPGVEISVMLKQVTADVRRETNNAQNPQQLSDMSRTFYFAKAEPAAAAAPQPAPQPKVTQRDHSIELAYWNSARAANDCEAVRAYLERFPDGIFLDLAKLSERRLCDSTRKITVVEPQPGQAARPQPAPPPPAPTASEPKSPTAADTPAPSTPPSSERKTAALPSPAMPAPKPVDDSSGDQADLARDLQRELARVGCPAGRPDGIWGARSRSALREFNRYADAGLDSDAPSKRALAALQKQQDRVCPSKPAPSRSQPETVRSRPRPAERGKAAAGDWRSISPLCQSAYYVGTKLCCTYDPPRGGPQIICP